MSILKGERLKELLFVNGKKSSELADYLGLSRSSVSKMTRKSYNVCDKYHQKIADFLGVSIDGLYNDLPKDAVVDFLGIMKNASNSFRLTIVKSIIEMMQEESV